MTKEQVKKVLNEKLESKKLSCWDRGVIYYAFDLLKNIDTDELPKEEKSLEKLLLNGVPNWYYYSWAGRALCYDVEICERLATPSEQKKKDYGRLQPNSRENWLDVQARALKQAFYLLYKIVNNIR